MKRVVFFQFIALCISVFAEAQSGVSLYKKYCAGCHGRKLEGASGPGLKTKSLIHGNSSTALYKSIKNGFPGTEMAGFGKSLSNTQITALVNFIRSSPKSPAVPGSGKGLPGVIATKNYRLKIEKLVTKDLNSPWAIEFIDKQKALISERKTGNLRWLIKGKLDPKPITGLPPVFIQSGTSGMMDIALDPAYKDNGWVYVAFSHSIGPLADKDSPAMTKVIRGRVKGYEWIDQQTLFEVADSQNVKAGDRWGCRFLFDKSGFLYFSIGDMGKALESQDSTKPVGKVYRINPDGSIPADNPYIDSPGALPAIYTMGNRNVQGMAIHPVTGDIWASEHGPKGGDELNILRKGANYGWPVVTFGIDYDGTKISDSTHSNGMMDPVTQWTPSIAVCPVEFCSSPLFKKWQNNLFVGALAFEELRRLTIADDKVIAQEKLFKGYGRIRDIKFGPDGALYVVFNNPDRLVRITPLPPVAKRPAKKIQK